MKKLLTMLALVLVTTISAKAEAAQCKIELQNGRGMTLETFRGHGYDQMDACQEARRDCRHAIRAGYYRARVLNCVKVQQRNRRVHKSCTAKLVNPRRYRTIQSFLGQASGQRGSGVKAKACRKAMKQCRKFKERNGRYRAQCITDGRASAPRLPVRPTRSGRRVIVLDA